MGRPPNSRRPITASVTREAHILRKAFTYLLGLLITFSVMPNAARAGTAPTIQQPKLAEIVVTAQKRKQKAQDVPMSISVLSGASLDNIVTGNFTNVLLSVPGLSYSGSEEGQGNYSIRGVSTGASSPTTGLYLDGISMVSIATNFAGATNLPLFDLARIEVLKGPQGTLYGDSSMGGAIKYVTRKPNLHRFTANAAGGIAMTDGGGPSHMGEAVVNMPLVPGKLAVRAGVSYRDEGGYINYVPNAQGEWTNISATSPPAPYAPQTFASGGKLDQAAANTTRNISARVSVKAVLSGGLTLIPEAMVERVYEAEPPWYWGNLPNMQTAAIRPQPTHDSLNLFVLPITRPIGDMKITWLSGYWDRHREWNRDYTYFIASLVPPLLSHPSSNASDTDTKTFSQEVRLASNSPTSPLKWLIGLYYRHQSDQLSQTVDTAGAGAFFGTGTNVTYLGVQTTKTSEMAAFGNVSYAFSSRWEGEIGLRYFDIDTGYHANFAGVFNGGSSKILERHSANVGVSPRFVIRYHIAKHHMLYVNAAKGFRAGGPNRFNTSSPLCAPDFKKLGISSAPSTYQSDNLWTYEFGNKNAFLSDHMIVNVALYYTDWNNIQQQVNLPSCGFQFVGNVGSAKIKGAELDIKGIIVPGVIAGGYVDYTDSRITSSVPGVSAQIGDPTLDTPMWAGNVYVDFALPMVHGWRPNFRVNYSYHGSNLRSFSPTLVATLPGGGSALVADGSQIQRAYRVGNAALQLNNGNWQLRLYVDNFMNARPLLDNLSDLYHTLNVSTLRPRTIGLMARVYF